MNDLNTALAAVTEAKANYLSAKGDTQGGRASGTRRPENT